MWFIFVIIHVFFLAWVNYIDEYLTNNNKVSKSTDIHTRIGGLLLVSTLMSFVGASILGFLIFSPSLFHFSSPQIWALLSAIPMVTMYGSYFYLLNTYPTYQVVPLFQISSVWMLIIELLFGGTISLIGLMGVAVLMAGAYLLDAGTLKWQIPTKLLWISIPATSSWAIALFMVRHASQFSATNLITFWQLMGIGLIGVVLFVAVKKYRDGFLFRLQHQGKNFMGFSLLNEGLAESGYVFGNLAVAMAPVAAYVTAMSGVQSVFLLGFLKLFPQSGRKTQITSLQVVSILLIALGVFLIEVVE